MQNKPQLKKPFNFYKDGLDLEFLRVYCIDHGKTRIMKRGEIFEEVGNPSQYVAYVERGYFKYMVHNDEEGKDYCTGFAFEGGVRCELSELSFWQKNRNNHCDRNSV